MRAQASVELILIVAITVVLGFLVLVKYTNAHEGVFVNAMARQELVHQIGLMDTKYTLEKIQSVSCGSGQAAYLKVSVVIQPNPNATDRSAMASAVAQAASSASGRGVTVANVFFNDPSSLKC